MIRKTKKIWLLACGLLFFASLTACSSQTTRKTEITISAAASLQSSLTEVAKLYEAANSDVKLNLDFAGSGAIREKVITGAPIDGVLLASQSDIDKLGRKVEKAKAVLGNQLVLISNVKSNIKSGLKLDQLSDLASLLKSAQKIAIGNPDTVPAGAYAEQSLTKLDLYTQLQPKYVQGADVTQVLSYVAAGNADLGFVYTTDAKMSKQVKVLTTLPENSHQPIAYYAAAVSASSNNTVVEKFNDYLLTTQAQDIFAKYGFIKK